MEKPNLLAISQTLLLAIYAVPGMLIFNAYWGVSGCGEAGPNSRCGKRKVWFYLRVAWMDGGKLDGYIVSTFYSNSWKPSGPVIETEQDTSKHMWLFRNGIANKGQRLLQEDGQQPLGFWCIAGHLWGIRSVKKIGEKHRTHNMLLS